MVGCKEDKNSRSNNRRDRLTKQSKNNEVVKVVEEIKQTGIKMLRDEE